MNTYEDYKKVTDKQHLSKAKRMPIRFLKASGKGFFVEKDGYALALRDEIGEVVGNMAFGEQMGDVLGYRSLEYYRRRYEKKWDCEKLKTKGKCRCKIKKLTKCDKF